VTLQLLLICPECEQRLTPEEMAYGHDCEVFGESAPTDEGPVGSKP